MVNLYDKMTSREVVKLTKLLNSNNYSFKKNEHFALFDKKLIIIVKSGYIQLIKTDYEGNKYIVDEYYSGMSFITNKHISSSNEYEIISKDDSILQVFDYDEVMNTNSFDIYYNKFIKNVTLLLDSILEEESEHVEILGRKNIRDKLLKYFDIMFKKSNSNIIYLPFSYNDLANYLSIDRSAMSRELKYLKDEGFISSKGRKINLLYKAHFTFDIV